jgi:hypothetical protein
VAVQNDAEAESVVHGLVAAGYAILMTVEQDETHRLATASATRGFARGKRLLVEFERLVTEGVLNHA